MSTVCCISDPSCPVIPGGASRIFEWSLHGGAAVESIIMLGSRWSSDLLGEFSWVDVPDVPHVCVVYVESFIEDRNACLVDLPPEGV